MKKQSGRPARNVKVRAESRRTKKEPATKRGYRVEVTADYYQLANSPSQVRTSLVSALKREGLQDINFDITVARQDRDRAIDTTCEDTVESKVEKKVSRRGRRNRK